MDTQIFLSQRGFEKIAVDGFIYIKDKKNWVCERRGSRIYQRCNGRAKRDGSNVVIINEHNHPPDFTHVEQAVIKAKLYKTAETSTESSRKQIFIAIESADQSSLAKLPQPSNLARSIRRRRQKNVFLPTPRSLFDIEITDQVSCLQCGENFLYYDSGKEDLSKVS